MEAAAEAVAEQQQADGGGGEGGEGEGRGDNVVDHPSSGAGQPQQPALTDTETGEPVSEPIDDIHNAAMGYLSARDAITEAKAAWEVCRDKLIVEMKKHGKTTYKHGGVTVTITDRTTLTVRDK